MNCNSCGRPLKNLDSIRRGYGPSCYKKILKEHQENTKVIAEVQAEEQIEGQIDIEEAI